MFLLLCKTNSPEYLRLASNSPTSESDFIFTYLIQSNSSRWIVLLQEWTRNLLIYNNPLKLILIIKKKKKVVHVKTLHKQPSIKVCMCGLDYIAHIITCY